MIWLTAKVNILTLMERCMKENGFMISSMEKEGSVGRMVQYMKGNTNSEKRMGMGSLTGLIPPVLRVISKITIFMVLERTNGQMVESSVVIGI